MSSSPSQAFRTQSSSKIISIPARRDPKSNQYVVLLKDIQLFLGDVKCIMCGADAVCCSWLMTTLNTHQPDMVLKVITADDNQGDSGSMGVPGNNSHAVSELSVVTSSSSEAMSVARTTDNNQALITSPKDQPTSTETY
ncbi:MAG: hypothetical protein J3Q66DRAFT_370737 [Benniella sp.]|nr:MAG: hypothetical protein J3Q66DRAFT_370737 [Benniella sp.]